MKQFGMLSSHSRRVNCLDNACIESFFSHLKTEKIYLNEAANKRRLNSKISNTLCSIKKIKSPRN